MQTAKNKVWSEIEIAYVNGRSKLIGSKSIQPLKILNPGSYRESSHVVLSSYGGGIVTGDEILIKLTCNEKSKLFLNSQSNTKIFKSESGLLAKQQISANIKADALTVIFPDPVVLQKGSRYHQEQSYHLENEATLLLIDWFHSGRMDLGEKFQFEEYLSEIKIYKQEKLVLKDRFSFHPEEHIADSPANFAGHQTFFSAYLVGDLENVRYSLLEQHLQNLKAAHSPALHTDLSDRELVVSVAKAKENIIILRAMAKSRIALQPLSESIMQVLSRPEIFGYNPLERKY